MDTVQLVILILATWRITNLLVNEDGPFDVIIKFRDLAGIRYDEKSRAYGTNVVARALLCPWCTSFWVGVFITIGITLLNPLFSILMFPFALSGGALVVKAYMHGHG